MLVESIDKEHKNIVFIYTTCQDLAEAKYLSLSAIQEKLAICADFWEVNSIYPWHGVIQDVNQYMVMITTEKSLAEKLIAFVASLHSYSIPMISSCEPNFTNPAYLTWAYKTLNNNEAYKSAEEEASKERSISEDGYHPGHLK